MQYTVVTDSDGMRAALKGRFTFEDHPLFRGLVGAIETTRGRRVALDLSGLDFIDSAGLGMLLVANDACRKGGLTLIAEHPKGQVRRTLEISAMGSMFRIET